MADITCSHCGEPWDVHGLRHDSIAYVEPDDGDTLTSLESVAAIVDDLSRHASAAEPALSHLLAEIDEIDRPLTLTALHTWWHLGELDDADPHMKAAKRVVETAIYRGVLRGMGCPGCGFAHRGTGDHRDAAVIAVLGDGVTDDDPSMFIGSDL